MNSKIIFVLIAFLLLTVSNVSAYDFEQPALFQYLESITCQNCTLDSPTFLNYTFPEGNETFTNHTSNFSNPHNVSEEQIFGTPVCTGECYLYEDLTWQVILLDLGDIFGWESFYSQLYDIDLPAISNNLNSKVNKSGDNMTGNIKFNTGLNLGNITGNPGLEMASSGNYNVSYIGLNDSSCGYIGELNNAYYLGSQWKKYNSSLESLIKVTRVCKDVSNVPQITIYYSPRNTGENPFSSFVEWEDHKPTLNTYYSTIKITALSGSGNDYACLDSAGTLYRSNTAC